MSSFAGTTRPSMRSRERWRWIGEATRCIPREVREKYAALPWIEMAGMRDKLIHAYFGINRAIIWTTVQNDIPPLRSAVRSLRDDLMDESLSEPRDP